MMILASIVSQPSADEGWPFVLNVLFWSGVLGTWIGIAVGLKKLFARNPPLSQVLAGLATVDKDILPLIKKVDEILEKLDHKVDRHEMEESKKDREAIRHELNNRLRTNEEALSNLRHTFATKDDLNTISLRAEAYRTEVQSIRDSINALNERTKTHIRKFDQLEAKLDRWIEKP